MRTSYSFFLTLLILAGIAFYNLNNRTDSTSAEVRQDIVPSSTTETREGPETTLNRSIVDSVQKETTPDPSSPQASLHTQPANEPYLLDDPVSGVKLLREPAYKYPLLREIVDERGRTIRMVGDHLVVRLQEGVSPAELEEQLYGLGAEVRRQMPLSGLVLVSFDGMQPENFDRMQETLRNMPEWVRYVEMDEIIRGTAVTPNDTRYPSQWGLPKIKAPEVWDLTTGRADVVIGIADSGIDYLHEDLMSQMWTNPGEVPGNGIDDDQNGLVDDVYGYDFLSEDSDPYDDYVQNPNATGHGTQQASIAAAAFNNNKGIAGVAPGSRLMALRIMRATAGGAEGIRTDAVEALYYAAMMRQRGVNIRVTNHSWAGQAGNSQALEDAIQANQQADMLVVVAAGNSGDDIDQTGSVPGSLNLPNIITVAATNEQDNLATFAGGFGGSNFGEVSVDLAAPGHNLQAAINSNTNHTTYRPSGSVPAAEGTSPAAPHVAAAVALCFSVAPANASAAEIKAAILNGVDVLPSLTDKVVTEGRLNLLNAVQNVLGTSDGPSVLRALPDAPLVNQSFHEITLWFDRDMDTSSFSLADITSLTGPGGAISPTGFSWDGTRTLSIEFSGQRQAGTYTVVMAPTVLDTTAKALDQDRDGTPGESTEDAFTHHVTLSGTAAGPKTLLASGTWSAGGATSLDVLFSEPMDTSGITVADIVTLEDPSGKDITGSISGISWSLDDRRMSVSFPVQSRQGLYRLVLSSSLSARGDGSDMDEDGDGTAGESTEDRSERTVLVLDGMISHPTGYAVYKVPDRGLGLTEGATGVTTQKYATTGDVDLGAHNIRLFDVTYTGTVFPNRSDFGLLAYGNRINSNDDLGFISQPLGDFPQEAVISPFWGTVFIYGPNEDQTMRQFAFQDRDGVPGDDHLVFEWHYVGFTGEDVTAQCMIRLNPGSNSSVLTFAYPDLTAAGEPIANGGIASVGIRPAATDGIFGVDLIQIAYHDTANEFIKEGNTLEISKPSSIGGRVYQDANNNGIQDGGESGVASRSLFLDHNGNGTLDADEPTVVSDADGYYSFGPLAWGEFQVRIVPNADTFSTPVFKPVSLDEEERVTGVDFGLAGSQLGIPAAPLPEADVGVIYSTPLQALGGVPPYTWAWQGGDDLPTGINLTTAGQLTGTPAATAAYKSVFMVEVTDNNLDTATGTFTLIVQDSENIALEDWKERNGVSQESDTSDGDADGLDLTREYAFGGTLGVDDSDKIPQFIFPENLTVQVEYRRRIGQEQYYQLESNDDLTTTWDPAPILQEVTQPLNNGFELVTATLDLTPETLSQLFLFLSLGAASP